MGQNRKSSTRAYIFRVAPESRHCATQMACSFRGKNRHRFRKSGLHHSRHQPERSVRRAYVSVGSRSRSVRLSKLTLALARTADIVRRAWQEGRGSLPPGLPISGLQGTVYSAGDLPDGQFIDRRVQPSREIFFALLVGQIISTNSRHPVPKEGRWPSSRT
jgi:hypothetical protein